MADVGAHAAPRSAITDPLVRGKLRVLIPMLTTRRKVQFASVLSLLVIGLRKLVRRGPEVTVRRRGISWHLDLREGIDLSLYLGLYERGLPQIAEGILGPGSVALDIGANLGVHSLTLAKLVGANGRVIAFEPTKFAYQKLCDNISLNPALAGRITACQVFLTSGNQGAPPADVYSSWPLYDRADVHSVLQGRLMPTEGAHGVPLDAFLSDPQRVGRPLTRIDFIKLDVDGHELEVLTGAKDSILRYRPTMLIEFAPYMQDEVEGRLESLLKTIDSFGYRLNDPRGPREVELSVEALERVCPPGASVDLLAYPT